MSYIELSQKLKSNLAEQAHDSDCYAKLRKILKDRGIDVRAQLKRMDAGLDESLVRVALSVLAITGSYSKGGQDRDDVINDGIAFFTDPESATQYRNLSNVYFGTKNYDQWRGQASYHEYCMGPRHGNICFSIGLYKEARNRELSVEEREACIYLLRNFQVVESARLTAKEQAA